MIILAYPDLAAATTQVQLPDVEQLPRSQPVRVRQNVFETDAGIVVVYDFGSQTSTFNVVLKPLSKTQAEAILAFFRLPIGSGGVNGRAGEWQLQDSTGVTSNIRFAQDVLEIQQLTANSWAVSLTLQKVL